MCVILLIDGGVAVDDVDTLESELMALQHSVQKYVIIFYICSQQY